MRRQLNEVLVRSYASLEHPCGALKFGDQPLMGLLMSLFGLSELFIECFAWGPITLKDFILTAPKPLSLLKSLRLATLGLSVSGTETINLGRKTGIYTVAD